jgi:hypothetical protein
MRRLSVFNDPVSSSPQRKEKDAKGTGGTKSTEVPELIQVEGYVNRLIKSRNSRNKALYGPAAVAKREQGVVDSPRIVASCQGHHTHFPTMLNL